MAEAGNSKPEKAHEQKVNSVEAIIKDLPVEGNSHSLGSTPEETLPPQ